MALFGSDASVRTTFVGVDKLSPVVRNIRTSMDGFKRDATTGFGLGAGISVFDTAVRSIGMVTDYLFDAAKMAAQEEAAISKLTTAIKENDRAWDGNIDAIEEVIRARQKLAFADDDQRESLARLVAVTGDIDEALALNRQAMDLARLKSMSLVDASELLGKVYAGNVGILSRYGIVLERGATATDALREIQRRTAGQAEAFAQTTAGSFQSMEIAMQDAQEEIGQRLLPVMAKLATFMRDVVAPGIVTVVDALEDLANNLIWVRLESERSAQQQEFDAYLKSLGLTAFGTGDALRRVGGDFGPLGEGAKGAIPPLRRVVGAMNAVQHSVFRTMGSMLRTMENAKDPWRQAWREMAAWAKDPFRPAKFEAWLHRRYVRAIDNARKAAEQGRTAVAKRWLEIANAMKDPIVRAVAEMRGDIAQAVNALLAFRALSQTLGPGIRRMGGPEKVAGRASGGTVQAGGAYVVGEHGPELLQMGSASGYITPSHRMGGGDIVVNVDGERLFRIVDRRAGRAMAYGGVAAR